MTSYRVEVSPNKRAGCQDALCKKDSIKIMKGEIRFGVWVEGTAAGGHEFQSWRWRHWGCVSGKTLQNIRDNLKGPLTDEHEYKWDNMDGLEEMPQDYQDKIKLAITEGKIADEDWKGDPAYNVLGKTGIRGRATIKKKITEEGEESAEKGTAAETPTGPAPKKRGRAKYEDEDEEAKSTKKRTTKAKKENEDAAETEPAKNPKAKEADKNEDDEPKSIRKPRARKAAKREEEINNGESMKKEPDDEIDIDSRPIKEPKGKKRAKVEKNYELVGIKTEETEKATIDVKPANRARGKKTAQEESIDESQVKMEGNEGAKTDIEDTYRAQKPEDPLEQIASAFCDRDGPLVGDFNDMVEAQEVEGSDWDGFLQKKFRNMVDAGEIADENFSGFLQKMHEREVAFKQPAPKAPKRGRKGKNLPKIAKKSRVSRGKAS